jgi:hypothetical protein
LVRCLRWDEATDVDCLGMFRGKGLSHFRGASLEYDAIVTQISTLVSWRARSETL